MYSDCHSVQYGLFDSHGKFLREVSITKVEEWMREVEQAHQKHRTELRILQTEGHRHTLRALQQLKRDLIAAKIRLFGGIEE